MGTPGTEAIPCLVALSQSGLILSKSNIRFYYHPTEFIQGQMEIGFMLLASMRNQYCCQSRTILILSKAMDEFDFYQPEQKILGQTVLLYNAHQGLLPQKYVVYSGFPYDEGTRRNGGRVGGSVASKIFRQTLASRQLYPAPSLAVFDADDIEEDLELEEAHKHLEEKHKQLLSHRKSLVVGIGGSNDQSYPNVSALLQTYPHQKIAVINLDSHFDVRPLKEGKAHSGSPFRLMLEDPRFVSTNSLFVEFGAKGATCAMSHYEYLLQKEVEVVWLQKHIRRHQKNLNSQFLTQAGQIFEGLLKRIESQVEVIFVSFDLDVISSKSMPGVSAPSVVGGLTAEEAFEIMRICGDSRAVKLVDFSEFNPAVESVLSSALLVDLFFELASTYSKRS